MEPLVAPQWKTRHADRTGVRMNEHPVKLEASWKERLGAYFERPDMRTLSGFLRAEKRAGKVVYPPGPQIFAAFAHTPFDAVKVVVLGQDPYHGPGQAHGLCFSVQPGVAVPPSLDNIFKEIARDLGIARPGHGCLTPWADRGVLLLNSVLTVERGRAGAHQGKGWEGFTDAAVDALNREREGLVFLLWGSYAQAKGRLIDTSRHCVLKAPHPSPLSAHRGFLGCGHFSAANRYLEQRGEAPVDWSLPARAALPEPAGYPATGS
jgi:uracil-DNA glycosylase